MKLLQVVCTFICLMFLINANAQSSSSMLSDEKAEIKKSSKASLNQPKSLPAQNNSDGYMGKKQVFLSKLTVNELPTDFPKYQQGMSAEQYKLNVRGWMKANKNLIKEEVKQKHKSRIQAK